MTRPLVLFGGLVNIPMWGYYNAYTAAQVDIIVSDAPFVSYRREKGKKAKGEFRKARALEVFDAIDKWEANRDKRDKDGRVKLDIGKYINPSSSEK